MRAIQITDWSTPDALRVSEIAAPRCGPSEVRMKVAAAPVSYALSLLIAPASISASPRSRSCPEIRQPVR
jgi:NADPH:quinone reductase-like Zn-dependent oxidoreductase